MEKTITPKWYGVVFRQTTCHQLIAQTDNVYEKKTQREGDDKLTVQIAWMESPTIVAIVMTTVWIVFESIRDIIGRELTVRS